MQIPEMQSPEWAEWRVHPQTKEFLKLLNLSLEATERQWSNKAYVSDDMYKGIVANAAAIGSQDALVKIIEAIESAGVQA